MNEIRSKNRDWSSLTLDERIHYIEIVGYLMMSDLLSADESSALKEETSQLETRPVDYSIH